MAAVMKRVILESPYKGRFFQRIRNRHYARRAMRDCLKRGEALFASHLLYTQCLDDAWPDHRRLGMTAGQAWFTVADLVVVYTDLGISSGMQARIEHAKRMGIPVIYRKLRGWPIPISEP